MFHCFRLISIVFCHIVITSFIYAQNDVGSSFLDKQTASVLEHKDTYFLLSEPSIMFEAMAGEIVVVILSTAVGTDYEIHLKHKNRTIIKAPLLESKNKQFALLGIPYKSYLGSYSLELVYVDIDEERNIDSKIFTAKKVIILKGRNNVEEHIFLNSSLAKRRTRYPSKKIIEQARYMWNLTGTVFGNDYFAFERFSFPLKSYKYFTGIYSDERKFIDETGNIVDSSIHGGMDIAASIGTNVYVPAAGRVVFAENRVITGKTIVISHFPGLYSLFYHLNDIQVQENDIVAKDTLIGKVGNTGFSTGPHLHWEMRVNNIRVDPLLSMGVLDKVFILTVE